MMQTCPPTKRNFAGVVNQWVIYDRYMAYCTVLTVQYRPEHDRYMAYEAAKEQAEEQELKLESSLAAGGGNKQSTRRWPMRAPHLVT